MPTKTWETADGIVRPNWIVSRAEELAMRGVIKHPISATSLREWTPRNGTPVRSASAKRVKKNQPLFRNHPFPLTKRMMAGKVYPDTVTVEIGGKPTPVSTVYLIICWYAANQGELADSGFASYPEWAVALSQEEKR